MSVIEQESQAGNAPPGDGLIRKIGSGLGWQFALLVGQTIVQLVTLGILGRWLSPIDFGLVALAASLTSIFGAKKWVSRAASTS